MMSRTLPKDVVNELIKLGFNEIPNTLNDLKYVLKPFRLGFDMRYVLSKYRLCVTDDFTNVIKEYDDENTMFKSGLDYLISRIKDMFNK